MFGSGAKTGIAAVMLVMTPTILQALPQGRTACYVAVVGAAARGAVAFRIAAATLRVFAPTTMAFALCSSHKK